MTSLLMEKALTRFEYDEQVAVFDWAALNEHRWPCLKLMFGSIMGGTKIPYKILNKWIKAGMKKGKPDIHLACARGGYHSLWIELKRRGGKVSCDQKEMIRLLRTEGNAAFMEVGAENAILTITAYLRGDIVKK